MLTSGQAEGAPGSRAAAATGSFARGCSSRRMHAMCEVHYVYPNKPVYWCCGDGVLRTLLHAPSHAQTPTSHRLPLGAQLSLGRQDLCVCSALQSADDCKPLQ